ncbi:MAG: LysR family transcriptional regulator [Myxococcota bacterium]
MFNWDDVRFFLTVHRQGNLARAGASLKLDPTTVGRRISSLEGRLGARLFDRTSHGYRLTAAGMRLLPRAEKIEEEALAVERDVAGTDQRLQGRVRLSATEMLTTRFIAPRLGQFYEQYPEICVELVCTNRDINLARREADIALRLARPEHEDLIVKKLFTIELGFYARPEYVEQFGMPPQSGDWKDHRVVMFAESRPFRRENGWMESNLRDVQVVMRSDSVSSIYSAAVGGLGVALLPCEVADHDPKLIRVPFDGAPEPRSAWQAVHRDLRHSARIRAVLDFLGGLVTPRARPTSGRPPARKD